MYILTELRLKTEKLFKGQIMRKMSIFEISSERKIKKRLQLQYLFN